MESLRDRIDQAVVAAAEESVRSGAYRQYVGEQSDGLQVALQSLYPQHQVLLTNSGTVALELALRTIGVTDDDEVILSGYDYPGNFWVVQQATRLPVLIDVQPNSIQVDLDQLDRAFTDRTRAVIVSHLHGQPQKIDLVRRWCDCHNVILIEDACQAIGAKLDDRTLGSFGHLALLSFGGSKVLSAGRGGALITSDERLFQKAKIAAGAGSGAYALSELSAAVVTAQLNFLDEINKASSDFFSAIERSIPATFDRTFLGTTDSSQNAYYQAGWLLHNSIAAKAIAQRLMQLGILAGSGFPGFHRRSARRCRTVQELSNTSSIVERLVVIHFSVALSRKLEPEAIALEFSKAIEASLV